jgi:Ni,Fe-hydrogenase III small subunit/formate hydrogenlyase subunit 6/NADH:ubiquinone oxidoreductase subunit I
MLDLLRTRLKQGTRTSGFPKEAPEFPDRFRGRPAFDPSRCGDGCRECARAIPSDLIQLGPTPTMDVGACLFSPEEATTCPDGAVNFTRDFRMASATRQGLRSATGEVELARALDERSRRLFGRSLRLRSVAAGSCNGCEAELVALGNVVFDLARFGVQFVASPRHADGLVITGAVSANMSTALRATYDAVPDPRIVIAVGACAINGGPFRGSPEVGDGVPNDLPVDLWVPGCPPHPLTVLDGLLRLLGRIDEGSAVSKTGSKSLGR